MIGRTGVPFRFAAQQRGPQAQTWGVRTCVWACSGADGATGVR
jgi:hypothetical protein